MVVVRLATTDHPNGNGEEKTYYGTRQPTGFVWLQTPLAAGEYVESFPAQMH